MNTKHIPNSERTCLRLPDSLRQAIHALGGFYQLDDQIGLNLDADLHRVQNYLGTYLPRTFLECAWISHEVLQLPAAARSLPTDRPLRVLDLGSGTGGAWMGLLAALWERLGDTPHPIEVHAVDGNAIALAQQPQLLQALYAEDNSLQVQLHQHHKRFAQDAETYGQDLQEFLQTLGQEPFDFILVSKHWNEFYRTNFTASKGIIRLGTAVLAEHLAPEGYLLVLELTDRLLTLNNGHSLWLPELLAHELHCYHQDNPGALSSIAPIPCAFFAQGDCAGNFIEGGGCYTQRMFQLALGSRSVNTKVCYRVLTHAQHAQAVRADYPSAEHGFLVSNADNRLPVCKQGRRQGVWQAELGGFDVSWQLHKSKAAA